MALTLADHAMGSSDTMEQAIAEIFVQESPVQKLLPYKKIDGSTYKYRQEDTLPGIEWRRANQDYSESTGVVNPRIEELFTVGGEVFIDNFFIRTQRKGGDAVDHKMLQYKLKA